MWTHLAKWHGMTETNIGMASETELITNNGEIAETLETYLFREGITEEIKSAIEEFQTVNDFNNDFFVSLTNNKIMGYKIFGKY